MKSVFLVAALAASALSSLDARLYPVSRHTQTCAQRIVGKQILGIGVVKSASNEPDVNGKYVVEIDGGPATESGSRAVSMALTPDQLCDFADSIESTSPGSN